MVCSAVEGSRFVTVGAPRGVGGRRVGGLEAVLVLPVRAVRAVGVRVVAPVLPGRDVRAVGVRAAALVAVLVLPGRGVGAAEVLEAVGDVLSRNAAPGNAAPGGMPMPPRAESTAKTSSISKSSEATSGEISSTSRAAFPATPELRNK